VKGALAGFATGQNLFIIAALFGPPSSDTVTFGCWFGMAAGAALIGGCIDYRGWTGPAGRFDGSASKPRIRFRR